MDEVLKCQHCHEEYTHVHGLIWYRRSEDEERCNALIATPDDHITTSTLNNLNPSSRRDGVRVIYWCECCHGFSSMNIVQHKGNTFLSFEKCPDDLLNKSFSLHSAVGA